VPPKKPKRLRVRFRQGQDHYGIISDEAVGFASLKNGTNVVSFVPLTYGGFAYATSGNDGSQTISCFDNGIASAETFGSGDVTNDSGLIPIDVGNGIASGETVGTPNVFYLQDIDVDANSIPSAEAVGTPRVTLLIGLDSNDETALIYDTFTEGSDTNINLHTPDVDVPGNGWEVWYNTPVIEADDNAVRTVSGSYDGVAMIDVGVTDYELTATILWDNGPGLRQYPGLAFRGVSPYNFMYVAPHSGSTDPLWIGAESAIAGNHLHYDAIVSGTELVNSGDTQVLRVRVQGTNIKAYVDDVLYVEYDTAANNWLDWAAEGTYVGIAGWTDPLARWYDFKVTELDGPGTYGIGSEEAFGTDLHVTHATQTIEFEPLLTLHDTFTETSAVTLENHTPGPVNLEGNSYTEWNDLGADIYVMGGINAASAHSTLADDKMIGVDVGSGNIEMHIDIYSDRDLADQYPGMGFRGVDADNFLFWRFDARSSYDRIELWKRESATNTLLVTGTYEEIRGGEWRRKRILVVTCDGDDITINWNNNEDITHTLTGGDETTFSAANGQTHGVYLDGADPLTKWENLRIYALDAAAAYGIESGEAFGEPDVDTGQNISLDSNGIASAEAFGSPYLSIMATGIASDEAFGSVEQISQNIVASGLPSDAAFGNAELTQVIKTTGIPSDEAVGSPSLSNVISTTGIPSDEAFGNADISYIVKATGISSEEAFGSLYLSIMATGIPGEEAFGLLKVGTPIYLDGFGIASEEAFGSADISYNIDTTGIPSGEAFGSIEQLQQNVVATGIPSGEAFGSADLSYVITTTGIPSDEAFGSLYLSIMATGIASDEAFGNASVGTPITPIGIVSAEAFGSPKLTQVVKPNGIVSGEAFGSIEQLAQNIIASGIPSAEGFGDPRLANIIDATGIGGGEAFGNPDLGYVIQTNGIPSGEEFGLIEQLQQNIIAVGVTSGEEFGNAKIVQPIKPIGISSGEAFGSAELIQIIKTVGIPGGEAFGDFTITLYIDVDGNGIASGEAVGTPYRLVFTDSGCVIQLVRILEPLQTVSLIEPLQVVDVFTEEQVIDLIEPDQDIDECERGVVVEDYQTN